MFRPDENRKGISARARAQLAKCTDRIDELNKMGRIMEANEKRLCMDGVDFGRELCRMKREMGHGNWLPLFRNGVFDFADRTAERYMRLYRLHKELRQSENGPIPLTVTKALRVLAEPGTQSDESAETQAEYQPENAAAKATMDAANQAPDFDAPGTEPTTQPAGTGSKPPKRPATSKAGAGDGWRTPDYIVEPVLELFGSIDLDPAADMDKHIPAKVHLTAEDDGLRPGRVWQGKVFLNPPSDGKLAGRFVRKLIDEHKEGRVGEAVVLLEAKTDTKWFRQLRPHIRAFLARPEFRLYPGVPDALVAIYLGPREDRFCQIFGAIGDIYTLYRPVE